MKRTPLKRRAAPKRLPAALSGPKAPRKPLPRENPVRRAKEHLRAYGPPERRDWISRQPSVLSGRGPCGNVHVRGGGASRKADARWIVPLTGEEHNELHQHGQKTFEAKYDIDLHWWAQIVDARWEQYVASQPKPETE